jgi:uncharacterized membrane protein
MDSVSVSYLMGNPAVLLIFGGLGVGFLLGIFTFSRLLTYLFDKARQTSYCMIVGLSLGSIVSMFCNGDVMATYQAWAVNGFTGEAWLSLGIGTLLFALGCVLAYWLVRVERKKNTANNG